MAQRNRSPILANSRPSAPSCTSRAQPSGASVILLEPTPHVRPVTGHARPCCSEEKVVSPWFNGMTRTCANRGWLMWLPGTAATLVVLAMSWSVASAQQVSRTGTFGGPGGSSFELACPAGAVMTGLRARSGSWIDALAPVCSRWVASSETLGEIENLVITGGNGGGPAFQRYAGRRGVVVGLEMFQADNGDRSIGHIIVNCGDYKQPDQFWNKLGGSAPYLGQSQIGARGIEHCGSGMIAAGIFGKSGVFIDRLGLLCVRSTALATGPPPRPNTPAPGGTAAVPGPPRCKSGFVWREARPDDLVCVTPESRARIAQENAAAASRVQPGGGPYGPATCRQGYVWREAFVGDVVCVTPEVRALVKQENDVQLSRQAR